METFSIAIPCWGSSLYVADALGTIAALHDKELEVVVSVNPGSADYAETFAALATVSGLTFRVIEPSSPLSMAEHYEWCLRNLSGQWVTILGADDGMLPWGLAVARRVLSAVPDAEALMFRRAYYFWPGVEAEYGDARISLRTETSLRTVDGERAVQNVLRGRGEHFDLPQIYTNNFVRRDVVDRIREASGGRVFHERNPDVYSGVAVAHFARTIVRCEVPAFWTGTSPSSMGLKQRQAIVSGIEEAREAVQVHFVEKSSATGHSVADEVGDELWLLAQDSPMYVLSACLRFFDVVASSSRWVGCSPRALVRSGFAATLVRASHPSRSAEGSARQRTLRDRVLQRCQVLGIHRVEMFGAIVLIAVTRALNLAEARVRKAASSLVRRRQPRGKLRVAGPDVMRTLGEANSFVVVNTATALPSGLELRFHRTLKSWPDH